MNHTPGPWKVFKTRDGSRLIGIGDANAEGIADCGFGVWRGGDAEAIANAHLIAAAPDLLAACEKFRVHYPSGINPFLDEAFREARDAIAKARGETDD